MNLPFDVVFWVLVLVLSTWVAFTCPPLHCLASSCLASFCLKLSCVVGCVLSCLALPSLVLPCLVLAWHGTSRLFMSCLVVVLRWLFLTCIAYAYASPLGSKNPLSMSAFKLNGSIVSPYTKQDENKNKTKRQKKRREENHKTRQDKTRHDTTRYDKA
jgi:hypothetical protein